MFVFVRKNALRGDPIACVAPIRITTTAMNSLHVATTAAILLTVSSMQFHPFCTNQSPSLEIHAEHKAQCIDLSIRSSAGLILMFVVWLDFVPLAERKDTANTFGSPAPLVKIAIVVSFSPDVGREVVGTQGEGSFCRQPVTISRSRIASSARTPPNHQQLLQALSPSQSE
jgi:hypothetical protein